MTLSAASCSVSCASYFAASRKVLHKSLTMKHCFRLHFITPRQAISFRYEALPSSFHYAVASRLRSVWCKKMENESLSVCNTTLSALYYDLQSSPLWLDFFVSHFYPKNHRHLQQIIAPAENSGKIKSAVILRFLSDITENLLYYR